jgi:hypothetical protein
MEPLTEAEQAALDFEKSWRGATRGTKRRALQRAGWSEISYYLTLDRALEKPAAEMAEPELVRRLKRLREIRARERAHIL